MIIFTYSVEEIFRLITKNAFILISSSINGHFNEIIKSNVLFYKRIVLQKDKNYIMVMNKMGSFRVE